MFYAPGAALTGCRLSHRRLLVEFGADGGDSYRDLITFVADRPGHDLRYAIDATRIRARLSWAPTVDLDEGLRRTVTWYLENSSWWQPIVKDRYAGERLGLERTGAP